MHPNALTDESVRLAVRDERKAIEAEQAAKVEAWNTVEHEKPAEAAQLGPSDDTPSDAEVAESLGRCYSNPAVHADVWLALQRIARRAGVKL